LIVEQIAVWRRPLGYSLLFLLMVVGSGCGDMKVAPVRGVVTLDGKPLSRASVTFQPEAGGRPSFGVSDENGNYRLGYSMNEEGAEIGNCKVRITTALEQGEEGSKRAAEKVPAKYFKEPLVVAVEPKSNTINLELTSAPK
jgi:hypothetical protein